MDDLDALLASVQAELNANRLAKADGDDKDATDSDGGGDSAPPDASAGSAAPPSAGPPGAPPDASASAGGPPPDASGSAPMDPAAGGAPGAGDPAAGASPAPDLGALKAEYDALAPEELQLHYLACKAALMGKMGSSSPSPSPGMGGPDASAGPAGPPAGPDMGAPPASAPPDGGADVSSNPMPPTAKSEMNPKAQAGAKPGMGTSAPMAKSEEAMADKALKEAVDRLEKSQAESAATIDKLAEIVGKVAGVPMRKSIANISEVKVLAKNDGDVAGSKGANPIAGLGDKTRSQLEPRVRAAVDQTLAKKLKNDIAKLTKSDRAAVISFDLGTGTLAAVEHLLG